MFRSQLPLNALRAFEASARHLSFTRAGLELRVTQAAVSHQIRSLEDILGVRLFRRLPRGLALTDEGQALMPALEDAFGRIQMTLNRFENGHFREVVTLGAVATFATGWLLPRLQAFQAGHPYIELRLLTNNNRVDIAGEGLDYAIRFGDGSWHGTTAEPLFEAPLAPVAAPDLARDLHHPSDLRGQTLLRSYRADEWPRWFTAAGTEGAIPRGTMFDSSIAMAEAAAEGLGVALLPVRMFGRALADSRLVRLFDAQVATGAYWLTSLRSRRETTAMKIFRAWLLGEATQAREPASGPASLSSSVHKPDL